MPAWVYSGKKTGRREQRPFLQLVFAAPFSPRFSPLLQFSRAFLLLNLFAHRKKAYGGSVAMVSAKAAKLGFGTDKS